MDTTTNTPAGLNFDDARAALESWTQRDVRAFVTRLPGWKEFRRANGIDSSSAPGVTKAVLIDWALAMLADMDPDAALAAGVEAHMANNRRADDTPDTGDDDDAPDTGDDDDTPAAGAAPASDPLASLRPVIAAPMLAAADKAIADLIARAERAERAAKNGAAFAPVASVGAPKAPATVTGAAPFKKLFGGRAHDFPVDVVETPGGAHVPAADPDYLWPADTPLMIGFLEDGANLFLAGPRGSGKSSFARQYAAVTGRPYFEVPFHGEKAFADLFGGTGPDGKGGMAWVAGDLLRAVQTPHAVVCLDEVGMGRPELVNGPLQTLLESREITLGDGTVARVAPGVRIMATNNNFGADPHAGSYAGLRFLNAAFRDRFVHFEVPYLDPKREARAIVKRTGAPLALAEKLVAFAALTRHEVDAGAMTDCVGLRRLMHWARGLVRFPDHPEAIYRATVENIFGEDDAGPLGQLAAANLDHKALGALAKGETPAAPAARNAMGFTAVD